MDGSYFDDLYKLPNDDVRTEEIDAFLDKLVFAVNQPNEDELGDIIRNELAAYNGHADVVRFLAAKDQKLLDIKDTLDRTPLLLAINAGQKDVVMSIEHDDKIEEQNISKEDGIDHPSNDGFTPLHAASSNGHLDVVMFLISQGANVQAVNDEGWTILHAAAQNGCLPVVQYLIDSIMFNVNIHDQKNDTPLHTAAFHGKQHVVEFLLRRQANINAVNVIGITPTFSAALNNNQDIVYFLLDSGAKVTTDDKTLIGKIKFSLIHLAAMYDNVEMIKYLIDIKGIDKDIGKDDSLTPLHVAAFFARGTSAFVVYDLVNQIRAFNNGTEEAVIGIVGDSIYLGVDVAEIGIEIAEAFALLEGVSSITGPIGAAIGAVVFVSTDIFMAVERVDKIDKIIHLTGNEKFIEGLRAFVGVQPEKYLKELLEEKELANELVKQGFQYLQQHRDIQNYIFPTGDYQPAPSYGSYVCENAIGLTDLTATGNHNLINLGEEFCGASELSGTEECPGICGQEEKINGVREVSEFVVKKETNKKKQAPGVA
ncbi:ankyrin-3-like [Phlebotomus papatasi]|uniref:ankyrin-3-like n=1 Tax=Phlebotomus papatasi TaxID=29031 RepID=UPI0024833A20|nr:ankyrin-3-like [Phlebotomus papatasi]